MSDVAITVEEAWELALYRTLKWESAPFIRAVTWHHGADILRLEIFCDQSAFDSRRWQDEIQSEFEQCIPAGLPRAPRILFAFRPSGEFEATAKSGAVLHVNHHFGAA